MLGWIALFIIVFFLTACATFITASCYQIIKSIHWTPKKLRPMPRSIEV